MTSDKTKVLCEKGKHTSRSNAVDAYVGRRIRQRRLDLNLSQTQMAARMGIAFQQIQKYELGLNRVSASRLWDVCHVLNVPVAYFFEGMDESVMKQSPMMKRRPLRQQKVSEPIKFKDPMREKDTVKLVEAINSIGDKQMIQILTALMKDMAGCR